MPENPSAAFITIQTVTHLTNRVVDKLRSQAPQSDDTQEKGLIYIVLVHFFVVMFLISVLRVIFTNPGQVPAVIFH